jgi:hypothetical protein
MVTKSCNYLSFFILGIPHKDTEYAKNPYVRRA